MLKIKDNVDLKELEKFGFKETQFRKYERMYDKEYYSIDIYVDMDDKSINIQNDNYDCEYKCEIPDVLYDLIKADLVEKVEE